MPSEQQQRRKEAADAAKAKKDNSDDSGSGSDDNLPPRQEQIPETVDYFLGKLLAAIPAKKTTELHKLYEDDFNKLTQEHYKYKHWPSVTAVSKQISDEPLFLILYRELYYRHLFAKLDKQVTFDDRKGAWDNYCKLFDLIIDDLQDGDNLSVVLPAQWLWDILDEFVYHYQTYCSTRGKCFKVGNDKYTAEVKENPHVWETKQVLIYLHNIVHYSKIEDYLTDKTDGNTHAFTDECPRLLGYFSLMQLLRMHSLIGDYHLALKTIAKIDINVEVPLYYKIPACHVTLYYYMGFAYLMMRRYADSIRTLGDILTFLSKTKSGVNSSSYQFDAMVKKRDQMQSLMLIALHLCPRQIDESLQKSISDNHGEKQARLQRGEEVCFEELFSYACPKFVSAAPPDFEAIEKGGDFNANEAHARQLKVFKKEMNQQNMLPRIGSYMKLYTAIKISKLAQLCDMSPDDLRDQLMCVMHKTSQKVKVTGGPPLGGDAQHCGEVEFYLDGDMCHINAQRTERDHAEVFLEQILKFQELLKKMGTP